MKKIILIMSILLFIYSCGFKPFPNMSSNNPVQVYAEGIIKNGKIDNNTIKNLMADSNNIEELFKKLYNDNITIISNYHYDWSLIGIPKHSNTDFYQILKEYCAVKTNDNYYTMLSNYRGKILTKGFCYSGPLQLELAQAYYADEKSKKLLYITEDITKLINIYGARNNVTSKSFFNNKYETHRLTINNDYNFYSIKSNVKYDNERRLITEYKLQLEKQNSDMNTIKYLGGKSSKMDINIEFEVHKENIPSKIKYTIKSEKGFTRKIDDFIGPLYINNKPYHYIYTYRHQNYYCPYNQKDKSFLLLPNGECYFEIDIDEIQGLPKNIAALTNFKYVSKYGTVKLNKTTLWDKANNGYKERYEEYIPMKKNMELLYK